MKKRANPLKSRGPREGRQTARRHKRVKRKRETPAEREARKQREADFAKRFAESGFGIFDGLFRILFGNPCRDEPISGQNLAPTSDLERELLKEGYRKLSMGIIYMTTP